MSPFVISSHSELIGLTCHLLENDDLVVLISNDWYRLIWRSSHLFTCSYICECFYIMCCWDLYCIYILIKCWFIFKPRLLCCCEWKQWRQNVIIWELPLSFWPTIVRLCAPLHLFERVFWALNRKSAMLAMLNTSASKLHTFLSFVPFVEFGMSNCGVMLFCDWYVLNKTIFPQVLSWGN